MMGGGLRQRRIDELDVLRGLAALAVVLYHYTTKYEDYFHHQGPLLISVPFGKYGVQLFFLISGFVILMTLEQTKHALDFVVSRFSRLYPGYWVAIAVTTVVVRVLSLPDGSRRSPVQVGPLDTLINFTMTQGFLERPLVDGAHWTLGVELAFYFVLFILYVTHLLPRIQIVCGIWMVLIIGRQLLDDVIPSELLTMVSHVFVLAYGHFFIAGIMFYLSRIHGFSPVRHLFILSCIFVEAVVGDSRSDIVGAAMVVAIFYMFSFGCLAALVCAPLNFLGSISYALYLIHYFIGCSIIYRLEHAGINPNVAVLVAIAAALAIATILSRLIEQPAQRRIREAYRSSTTEPRERWQARPRRLRPDPLGL